MPDIKNVFASEIRRLAKKEVKAALQPLQEQISKLRKTISEQNAKIKTLEKRVPTALPQKKEITPVADDKSVRMSPQWIIKLRQKLGLTQGQFAVLLDTSNFSVSHWELGKTTPRDVFKRKIAALRGIGKRELKRLLEAKDKGAVDGKVKAVAKAVEPKAKSAKVQTGATPEKTTIAKKQTRPVVSTKTKTPVPQSTSATKTHAKAQKTTGKPRIKTPVKSENSAATDAPKAESEPAKS